MRRNNERSLEDLIEILLPIIEWYEHKKKLETHPNDDIRIDDSYIHDLCGEEFQGLSRSNFVDIIEILHPIWIENLEASK